MPLSNYALDRYVAPEMSSLTECNAPDLSTHDTQSRHWVANFVLNSMFRVKVAEPYRAYTFMFLRRAEMAFVEHGHGRNSLLAYIDGNRKPINHYLQATFYFESCVGQTYQAFEIIRKWSGQDLFARGDGSLLERINLVNNRSKHADKAIHSNQLPPDATMPVWLVNAGLKAEGVVLTHGDLATALRELADLAAKLSNPDVNVKPVEQAS
jgi:hypothetical protein